MNDFFIALGANLPSGEGSPTQTVRAALEKLDQTGITVSAVSALYQTPCFPAGAGPDYLNAAAHLRSALSPGDMLARLHIVEAHFGRDRKERWGTRTIDLDLIACGDMVLPDLETFEHWHRLPSESQRTTAPDTLILPHPRLQDRAFVLVPLMDIAPQWRHPVLHRTVEQMLNALSPESLAEIVLLDS